MVEQLVAFALGFSICGLIGLAFLPLVSARARRLTLKGVEQQLPMTFDEMEAERDLLRARFAVERRELELVAERERQLRAADSAELGRRTADIVRVEEVLRTTQEQLKQREDALAHMTEKSEKLFAELGATKANLAEREAELRDKSGEFDALAEVAPPAEDRAGALAVAPARGRGAQREFRGAARAPDGQDRSRAQAGRGGAGGSRRLAGDA